ncbi:MAG: DUF1559 domain-containing protein [Pirellulaceae bacterium]|jgi:type II secretory pathway pseudopilin PulG|nr:DUF1559 domain-containing protein [Pirellulaceae bacterium]
MITILFCGAVVLVAIIGLTVTLFFPGVQNIRGQRQVAVCDQNLVRIGLALRGYHDEHGSLPPAVTTDANGKAMHSWRVLILPYLGPDEAALNKRYNFDEPWDSPQNIALANNMPPVFACPSDLVAQQNNESSYRIVIGRGTAFPGVNKSVSFAQITDGLSTTALVVEMPAAGTSWIEPDEPSIDSLQFAINGYTGNEVGSFHEGGAHVLMADGIPRYVADMTSPEYVRGMLTIDANDSVIIDTDEFE